jgi:hypothetical protein
MNDHSTDDLWELIEFSTLEALVLRSFLEYLRTWPDPWELKHQKIAKWQVYTGRQFGNPNLVESSHQIIQKLRAVPPEVRKTLLRELVNLAHSKYFDPDAS